MSFASISLQAGLGIWILIGPSVQKKTFLLNSIYLKNVVLLIETYLASLRILYNCEIRYDWLLG